MALVRVEVAEKSSIRHAGEGYSAGDTLLMDDEDADFHGRAVSIIEYVDPAEVDDEDVPESTTFVAQSEGVTGEEFDLSDPDDADAFADREYEAVVAAIESGEYDDYLEEIWEADQRTRDGRQNVQDALRERGYDPEESDESVESDTIEE